MRRIILFHLGSCTFKMVLPRYLTSNAASSLPHSASLYIRPSQNEQVLARSRVRHIRCKDSSPDGCSYKHSSRILCNPSQIPYNPNQHSYDLFPLAINFSSSSPTAVTQTAGPSTALTLDSRKSAIFFSFKFSP